LERIEAWGMASASMAYVYRPTSREGVADAFRIARQLGLKVGLKGAGNSYGDAFQNAEGVVLDMSRMNRVIRWDSDSGIIVAEPGLTIRDLWRYTIADGWWPPVVSGTSFVSLGGALSANIHGKNNWHAGPIGEHVLSLTLMTPAGETLRCSPEENSELFYAAIGGFGLLGVIVEVELRMKKLHSGYVLVDAVSVANWKETFEVFEERFAKDDYLVGWIDCFKGGAGAGRGLIHAANYMSEGEDPHPEESLSIAAQELPDATLGLVARTRMYKLMGLLVNRFDMRFVNWAKFMAGKRESGKRYRQPIVEFNFLLDSAPNWKWAYKPGALIQYQCFVPRAEAMRVFDEITRLSRERGMPPFLGVMKRHRPDSFLLSHAVDGYSLALDYPVYASRRGGLWNLCRDMTAIVLEAGGRFYFAKDSTLTSDEVRSYLGEDSIERFLQIKRRLDPDMLLQTELSKRVFGPLIGEAGSHSDDPLPSSTERITDEDDVHMPIPFWGESPEAEDSARTIEESVNLEVPE
jgi:decaprenylphospho-beta-D-ribofuranose 2-oxidase